MPLFQIFVQLYYAWRGRRVLVHVRLRECTAMQDMQVDREEDAEYWGHNQK